VPKNRETHPAVPSEDRRKRGSSGSPTPSTADVRDINRAYQKGAVEQESRQRSTPDLVRGRQQRSEKPSLARTPDSIESKLTRAVPPAALAKRVKSDSNKRSPKERSAQARKAASARKHDGP